MSDAKARRSTTVPANSPLARFVRRRDFLRLGAGAACGLGFAQMVRGAAEDMRRQGKACILLWMQGGPSQLETFDPKPEHESGGPTRAISTNVAGIRFAEHLPQLAQVTEHVAIIRSMTNREGNHQRATYQLHTGYLPSSGVDYPSLGAVTADRLGAERAELPPYITVGSLGPGSSIGGGFLGVKYDPLLVRQAGQLPENARVGVDDGRYERRLGLLARLDDEFAAQGAERAVTAHRDVYNSATRLARSEQTVAFEVSREPEQVREAYGDTEFGRGCLLARRLIEVGVPFVEVRLRGWDTHQDNFERVGRLAPAVDQGFAQLLRDLHVRGRLEKTLVLWMGEFGRTPRINPRSGRDHFPRAFSVAMAGGGVRGGQVIGATSSDGMEIKDRPVTVPDLFCSVCHSLGIDPRHENQGTLGRPIRIVDGGEVVRELFA